MTKSLPIHHIPASRMAALTEAAARRQRILRHQQRNFEGWTSDDQPPARDHCDNTGGPQNHPPDLSGLVLVGVVMIGAVGVMTYFILKFLGFTN